MTLQSSALSGGGTAFLADMGREDTSSCASEFLLAIIVATNRRSKLNDVSYLAFTNL